MAQLKDLIVNGASRFIGDTFINKLQITSISAPTSAGGTAYGTGTDGQVLKSNGTSVYWTTLGTIASAAAGDYVLKSGDTMTGNLLLSKDANTAWANAPALQLTGADSKVASVKLTNSGTNLDIGWDWTAREGAGIGFRSTSSTDTTGGFYLFARDATEDHNLVGKTNGDLTWTGLFKITNNSNTTTIGSQNASFCHIYNSVNIPFIFNNSVLTTGGNLGNSTYPFDNLTLGRSNGAGIYYQGTKATYRMIRFIDNTSDTYGNGISIGGGGQTIIGGGESADTAVAQAGTAGAESMWICNDGAIEFYPNLQSGWTTSYKNYIDTSGYYHGIKIYGAVWNDYAEYRKDNPNETQEPGRCVKELGDGALALTTKRLERGCEIISDTFGFAIGQDEENGYNTPIASNGRVLAYPYESIDEFAAHIGWPVCSGPNGTVSIMTEEEEEKYPSRIVGIISEIPTYDEWGTGKVKINGRIWIRVR